MLAIIFSKDRAMQLDALLRSMDVYFKDLSLVVVLWKSTTGLHKACYRSLQSRRMSHKYFFAEEVDFQKQTEWMVRTADELVFLVDDDIFYKEVPKFVKLDYRQTRSLRLGDNVNNKAHFNYTISVDGNIFRREDILPFMQKIEYKNPNELEGRLVPYQPNFHMLTTEQYVVGVPHNKVSTNSSCKFTGEYLQDDLAKMFIEGKRIDIDAMDYSNIRGVHSNIPYKFK